VVRVHDNWVRNAIDTTKTSDSEAIPMTPRLAELGLEGRDAERVTRLAARMAQSRAQTPSLAYFEVSNGERDLDLAQMIAPSRTRLAAFARGLLRIAAPSAPERGR
jgi:hypothetical protein